LTATSRCCAAIARERHACVAVGGLVIGLGTVSVGDELSEPAAAA
jgi:hypothetical protein